MITSEMLNPAAMGGRGLGVELVRAATRSRRPAGERNLLSFQHPADARGHPHRVGAAFQVGRHGDAAHAVAVDDLRLAPRGFHVGDLPRGTLTPARARRHRCPRRPTASVRPAGRRA